MERNLSNKNPEKHDERECSVNSVLSQNEHPCPSAAAGEPADEQGVDHVSTEINPNQNNDKSMAESVTRHASNPSVILKQYGYAGRESANPTNSLPDTLPEKGEQDQDALRVVESGRESVHVGEPSFSANNHSERIIRKTIDQTKQEDYNLDHGKSDRIKGPRKEINNGSI